MVTCSVSMLVRLNLTILEWSNYAGSIFFDTGFACYCLTGLLRESDLACLDVGSVIV